MDRRVFRLLSIASLLLVQSGYPASASSLVWSVTGTFADGGSLAGWFTFDTAATNDTALDYSLSVAGGDTSIFPAWTFTKDNSFSGGGFSLAEFVVNDNADHGELLAYFSSNLNAVSVGSNAIVMGAEFSVSGAQNRTLSSGSATGELVPEPGTLFMSAGLASLMARRRRSDIRLRRSPAKMEIRLQY